MYLKRLEVFGFKSFAEKTELDFGNGITAVVGPNGSGKSNVADAIRWVLGEQSAKALRGGNMADVIFAGSDGKRAMGFAQVSLVLDNTDGKLGVGFAEVMVTRRVDRSGEGEYFINQVSCRLKDVHELFMDTGVGKENYSIIGQGKIDEILSTKPEDRRGLFEEAAGISRYKARKREAQRRLDETEQNLLRITDIVGELASQMETLHDQASRAESYSSFTAELTRLDVGVIAHGLAHVADKLATQVEENRLLQEKMADIELKLAAAEQAADIARNLSESIDQELTGVSQQVSDATGQAERSEGRLALAQQQDRAVLVDRQRLEAELSTLETKLVAAAEEHRALQQQVLSLQADLTQANAAVADHERVQAEQQIQLATESRAVEDKKDRIVTILQEEAEKRNAAAGADRAGDDAARRLTRLQGERAKAEAEAAAASDASGALVDRMATLATERDQVATAISAARSERQQADQLLQEMQQKAAGLREEIQGSSARLGAIEEMMNAFEGYQKGTRTVLLGRERNQPWAAEVLGSVAELIRTEPQYEKAIEIALGGNIQNLVTATDGGAKQAIEHLKRTGGGRATFLPLNVIRPNSFRSDEEKEFGKAAGILGVAADLVRYEEKFHPAILSLLGRTLIASDMDAALAFGRKSGMRYRIVTLEGELLSAGGALTGGSVGGQGSGLLTRERERDELTAKLVVLKQELAATRTSHDQVQAERAKLDQRLSALEPQLRAVETQITQAEGESTRLSGEARRWSDLLKTFEMESDAIQLDAKQDAESGIRLRSDLTALASERSELEARVAEMVAAGQARLGLLEDRGRALTAAQVRAAELVQQARDVSGQVSRIEAQQDGLNAEREAKKVVLLEAVTLLETLAGDMETARLEVGAARLEKERLEAVRADLQRRKLETLEQANGRDREIRTLRRTQTDSQSKLQQGEVEEARLGLEQTSITERLREQYGLAPEEVVGQGLSDKEIQGAKERTQELRDQIRELGPVNLGAIEEYQTAQERFTFLGQQRGDLDEAKGSLYRAIEELDKRTKREFLDAFQLIRKEFQKVYTELFEGGKADLHLVDENDLLETGIEIVAQPPGKKPQTLSLLSGGERAMTAIALLFALLRTKPTPFVVLDEVEAALDESNVERFGRYLKTFAAGGSQFICITHQRGTMEVADALYGVTMEGAGISRVVSVRLVDMVREAS